jgi:hypothetical protein
VGYVALLLQRRGVAKERERQAAAGGADPAAGEVATAPLAAKDPGRS